jgi:biotin carboxyl carrier protein
MTVDVDIDGQSRPVHVEPLDGAGPAGGRFRIRIGAGDPEDVDVRLTDLGVSIVFADGGRIVDAALTERPGGEWLVQFSNVAVAALVNGRRRRRGAGGDAAAAGPQRITAPMPGRIVRVLVKPGEDVAARQGLVVVEAMKMENELSAVRAGRVSEIAVAEGVSVEAGRLLVVVE